MQPSWPPTSEPGACDQGALLELQRRDGVLTLEAPGHPRTRDACRPKILTSARAVL
jgi:hypothetical protein